MVNHIDDTLAALAEPTRLRVVELLRQRPLRAGEIAARVGVTRPALSRHLRALRASGLVDVELSEEDGRGRRYRLRSEGFVALQAWMDEMQSFWTDQLEAFREHAERGPGGQE